MLVLSRKNGETIRIGDEIEVTVVGVQGGRIKLGIRCPRWITVDRAEVAGRKDAHQILEPIQS